MNEYIIYLVSCDTNGGIHRYILTKEGKLEFCKKHNLDRPMFIIESEGIIYALLREPYNDGISCAASYKIKEDGSLTQIGNITKLDGVVACHMAISPDSKYLYSANYMSGSVSEAVLTIKREVQSLNKVIQHCGHSIHSQKQTGPHAHCTVVTPDGKYLCVADLGIDKIILYKLTGKGILREPYYECIMTPGTGPRHLVFSKDGTMAYCSNELINAVTVLSYREGKLKPLGEYRCVPEDYKGESHSSAIRISPCGKYLYVANRVHDSIACFLIEGAELNLLEIISCGGQSPRDFNLTPDGKFLICANQDSNNVSVFRVNTKTGRLIKTEFELEMPMPFCVMPISF